MGDHALDFQIAFRRLQEASVDEHESGGQGVCIDLVVFHHRKPILVPLQGHRPVVQHPLADLPRTQLHRVIRRQLSHALNLLRRIKRQRSLGRIVTYKGHTQETQLARPHARAFRFGVCVIGLSFVRVGQMIGRSHVIHLAAGIADQIRRNLGLLACAETQRESRVKGRPVSGAANAVELKTSPTPSPAVRS